MVLVNRIRKDRLFTYIFAKRVSITSSSTVNTDLHLCISASEKMQAQGRTKSVLLIWTDLVLGISDFVRFTPIWSDVARLLCSKADVCDLVHSRYFTIWPRFGTGYLRFGPIYSDLVRQTKMVAGGKCKLQQGLNWVILRTAVPNSNNLKTCKLTPKTFRLHYAAVTACSQPAELMKTKAYLLQIT